MYLVFGSEEDNLAREICRQNKKARLCTESELFEGRPFAFEKSGARTTGFITVGDSRVDLGDLEGVLVRSQRNWWPSPEFDAADQMFVYHETVASWYALLTSLRCPVVNRFGLSWWVHDSSYPLQLLVQLGRILGVASLAEVDPGYFGRLCPTSRSKDPNVHSVYLAGDQISSASDNTGELERLIRSRQSRVRAWQADTGVYLCRIDCTVTPRLRIHFVEPFPMLHDEPEERVRQIAAAALEVKS